MAEKILFVDDEQSILDAMRRHLRKQFELDTALGGWEGLEAMNQKGPYAVVVSDMRMPGMDGVQFLAEVKTRSPETVRVMLTGNADLQTAIDAVNEGYIFRFLTKPCPPEVLARTIAAGLVQHQLITAEKELLEKTLSGSVKMLTEILSLVNPTAFGKSLRMKRYVMHVAKQLNLAHNWQFELAALLSQIGTVILPGDTLNKIYSEVALSPNEQKLYDEHTSVARNLLANIPRLGSVARMVEAQKHVFSRSTVGDDWSGENVVELGGHILKAASDFDQLLMRGISPKSAIGILEEQPDEYVPEIVAALATMKLEPAGMVIKEVAVRELDTTMMLNDDVRSTSGMLLANKGQEVTITLLHRLRAAAKSVGVVEPISVMIERPGV